jgi:predicted component of type VI protein secretion system
LPANAAARAQFMMSPTQRQSSQQQQQQQSTAVGAVAAVQNWSQRRGGFVLGTHVTLIALQPTVDEGEWGIPSFIVQRQQQQQLQR